MDSFIIGAEMLRFEGEWLIFIGDIERCPFVMWSDEAAEFHKNQNRKEVILALERYLYMLDYLRHTAQKVNNA